jgi:hypothetical protein
MSELESNLPYLSGGISPGQFRLAFSAAFFKEPLSDIFRELLHQFMKWIF